MRFKDRAMAFVSRFLARAESSFASRLRVFMFIAIAFLYSMALGAAYANGECFILAPAAFRYDMVYFLLSLFAVYLSGCTVFAGPVCFVLIMPYAFLKGFDACSFYSFAAGIGTGGYYICALLNAAVIMIYCLSSALAVGFSAYSALGVREMLFHGRFTMYSILSLLLIVSAFACFCIMFKLLF